MEIVNLNEFWIGISVLILNFLRKNGQSIWEILFDVIKVYFKKLKHGIEISEEEEQKIIHETYSILNYLLLYTAANRVLILVSANDGKLFKEATNLYSTVLFELHDDGLKPVKKTWQRQTLDLSYVKLLKNLFENSSIDIDTKKIEKGDLKNIYEANGIVKSKLYTIYKDDYRLIYVSLNYLNNRVLFPQQNEAIRNGINQLKKLKINLITSN